MGVIDKFLSVMKLGDDDYDDYDDSDADWDDDYDDQREKKGICNRNEEDDGVVSEEGKWHGGLCHKAHNV